MKKSFSYLVFDHKKDEQKSTFILENTLAALAVYFSWI